MDEGMQDFLAKPVQPNALFTTLARWLGHKISSKSDEYAEQTGYPAQIEESRQAYGNHADMLANMEFHGFKHIDSHQGLSLMMGKRDLYLKVLSRFAESQAHTGRQLQDALAVENDAQALILAHTLKGLAGSIGAKQLHADASQLELVLQLAQQDPSLRNGCKPICVKLVVSLNQVLAELNQFLPPALISASDQLQSTPVSHEEVQSKLQHLMELLSNFSGDCPQYFDEQRHIFLQILDEHALAKVDQHIQQYDYDDALLVLRTAMTS